MFESYLSRPWRVRQFLYVAATVLVLFIALAGREPRALIVLGLGIGGVITSLGGAGVEEPSSRRLLVFGGYDLGNSLALAALGMQYSSLLILVGATAALSLLRPTWGRRLAPTCGIIGAGAAFLSVQVAEVPSVVRSAVAGEAFSVFVPMAAVALITAGLAWVFSSVGARLQDMAHAQEQLRRSLDDSPAPKLVSDGDDIVYANGAAVVFVGRHLIGESLRETFGIEGPFGADRVIRTELSSIGETRVLIEAVTQLITFDGRPHTMITLSGADETSGVDNLVGTAPRRLDLLFDRIPVALYRSAPSGEVLAANPALADMLGLSDPAELLGAVQRTQAHYRDLGGRQEWLAMFDGTDVVMNYEMELTRADGTLISVTDSARAIRDRNGDILMFEGVLVDVTSRRQVEESRRRISEILEATSDLVWLTDEHDRINRLNAAMRRFLDEADGPGLIDSHVGEFITDAADAARLRSWRETPDGPHEWRGEIVLRSRSGREILTSAVAQRHQHFISLVARDITEERRTARQLEEVVASKDEFIASVSHELRTPLTAVVGLASELTSFYDVLDDETKRDFIGLVADQASEVAAIVEDLLVAARADIDSITLIHEEVDLRRAVDAVLAALPVGKREQFDVSGEGVACGDAQRIRQVVRNLITNAIRYGELPGAVGIEMDGDQVAVSVCDKGPGIEPAMIDRIFQPYERAHTTVTQPNSVGLGLSVSRWLAEKMGGSLVYENDIVSTFVLRLPARRCG
ncbi:MAG TPA: ATP-binding protein [Acidimicrobiia bacterium]|nr:ATP-binding protein [Acidimicrobiia bacterium]